MCDSSKWVNLGPCVQRINKSRSCEGGENDDTGLCDASATPWCGDVQSDIQKNRLETKALGRGRDRCVRMKVRGRMVSTRMRSAGERVG